MTVMNREIDAPVESKDSAGLFCLGDSLFPRLFEGMKKPLDK